MISNHARVGRALYLLKLDLDSFIPREFLAHHRDEAPNVLHQVLGQYRDPLRPFHNMKTQDLLSVMQSAWWEVFDRPLSGIEPSLVRELALAHEGWANRQAFTSEATFQILNSIQRLLTAMSSPSTLELEMLKVESLEAEEAEAVASEVVLQPKEEAQSDSAAGSEADPDQEAGIVDRPDPSVSNPSPLTKQEVEPAATETGGETGNDAEPFLAELLQALRDSGALQEGDSVAQTTRIGPVPELADASAWQDLNPAVAQALADAGMGKLYHYQSQILDATDNGTSVALTLPLGSEPALNIGLTMAERLLRNPGSHGLVICPEEDRVGYLSSRLDRFLSALDIGLLSLAGLETGKPPVADDDHRQWVAVVSVDALNRKVLAGREEWGDFLGNLSLVALDGAQEYRGILGSHVAVLLRRLAHLLSILGAAPPFMVSAVGCANGEELAENLTGRTFRPVSSAAFPEGKRHFISLHPTNPPERSGLLSDGVFHDRVARAVRACLDMDKSVVVLARGSVLAQQCHGTLVQRFADEEIDAPPMLLLAPGSSESPDGPAQQRYQASDAGIVFTSACFRDSVDLASYDGVVLAGFPESFREALQGMYGIGGPDKETFCLCVALNDPQNGFLARHIDVLLDKQPESIVADPGNQEAIQSHLPSLLQESEDRIYSFSSETLGGAVFQELRREADTLSFPVVAPQQAIDLKGEADTKWALVSEGTLVDVVSDYRKFREAYEAATMTLAGARYRVLDSNAATEDWGEGSIEGQVEGSIEGSPLRGVTLEPLAAQESHETVPHFLRTVKIQDDSLSLSLASGVSLHLGIVGLEEQLTQVDVIETHEGQQTGADSPDAASVPARSFVPDSGTDWSMVAQAFWVDFSGLPVAEATSSDDSAVSGSDSASDSALEALEQMFRLGLQWNFAVDDYGIITCSTPGKVFMLEAAPGCLGVVKKAFDCWRDILEAGASLARQYDCEEGSPLCPSAFVAHGGRFDQAGGLSLANRLLEATRPS
ncbi:MAG: hypothetical protein F4X65_10820 [Chloroflexi bacterium]|nr:hypothetical protein [Chloroflexota bacterium]